MIKDDIYDAHRSTDDRPPFKFTCLSENEFSTIFKQVKRERRSKQEEKEWQLFLQNKIRREKEIQVKQTAFSTKTVKVCIIKHSYPESSQCSQTTSSSPAISPTFPNKKKKMVSRHVIRGGGKKPPHDSVIRSQSEKFHSKVQGTSSADGCICSAEIAKSTEHFNIENLKDTNVGLSKAVQKPPFSNEGCSIEKESCTQSDAGNFLHISITRNEVKRMEELKSRLISVLHNILVLQKCEIDLDSDDELSRIRKRTVEFTARFTRNYLYQFKCQASEMKKLLSNTNEAMKKKKLIFHKCLSSYQIGVQALQAFEKHLPTYFVDGVPSPITEFLTSLSELSALTNKIFNGQASKHDELQSLCRSAMTAFKEYKVLNEGIVGVERTMEDRKRRMKCKKKDNLWMYSSSNSKSSWKKKSAALAKVKFGSPVSQENVVQPPLKKEEENNVGDTNEQAKQKYRTVDTWRNATRGVTEDQVRTMMEIIPPDSPVSEANPKIEGEKAVKEDENTPVNGKDLKYSNICNFLNLALEDLKEILQNIKEITSYKLETKKENGNVRQRSNNVKFIYMNEEDGISRRSKHDIGELGNFNSRYSEMYIHLNSHDRNVAHDYADAIQTYKTSCPYYQSTNNCEPWNLIARVADTLVYQITQEVSRELEADVLVKKIFDLEFKE